MTPTVRAPLILALVLCVLAQCVTAQDRDPPNVLLIVVDDMGWSDLGAFGGEIETPNLDRLALGGLRFTQFHTTAKCFPSRAALLTGRYPEQVGMAESPIGVIRDSATIASALRSKGYRTFMVGKHHGSDNPLDLGFDRYVGLRDGASNHFNPGIKARAGEPEPARKKLKAPQGRWWCFDRDCVQGYTPEQRDFYTTDAYTDWALEFLQSPSEDGVPFFLYLAYQAPHDPLQAWSSDIERYLKRYAVGYAAIAETRYQRMRKIGLIDSRFPRSAPTYRDWDQLAAEERREETARMAVYAAMTDRIDQNIGRLMAQLQRTGEFDRTLILFTSDNGASAELVFDETGEREIGAEHAIGTVGRWASLGEDWANVSNTPFRYFKNFSFEGGTASPLILHWPDGVVDPGRVIADNTNLMDIFPTLLSVAFAESPEDELIGADHREFEGVDLSAHLSSSDPLARAHPVFQRWQLGRSVRTARWKLVSYAEPGQTAEQGVWQLYDMTVDLTETTDAARLHPEVVAELAGTYDEWRERVKTESR